MKVSAEHFRRDLSKLRTGRASINLFEDLKVEYYGALTPINQLAGLAIPDPTLITVTPWDPTLLESIDKAIRAADLGLNPINDGKTLKVPIPPLDDERRREMAKRIRKMLEEEKTALRNMRRESKDEIEQLEKDKQITEDEKFNGLELLQKLIDDYSKKTEEVAAAKERKKSCQDASVVAQDRTETRPGRGRRKLFRRFAESGSESSAAILWSLRPLPAGPPPLRGFGAPSPSDPAEHLRARGDRRRATRLLTGGCFIESPRRR